MRAKVSGTSKALLQRQQDATETIESVRARTSGEFGALVETIRALGTDSRAIFGEDYYFEGGFRLQQRTNEIAALCMYLSDRAPQGAYLEIGTANGGTCRLLQQRLSFSQVLSVDDGRHPGGVNLTNVANLFHFTGDSHSPEAAAFIGTTLRAPLAVALIDGDHTYKGVLQDTHLVLRFATPGTLLVYHDIAGDAHRGVRRHWMLGAATGLFRPVARFVDDRPGALGIGVAEVPAASRRLAALLRRRPVSHTRTET
jgi:cephalosporin hydroxylase